MYHDKFSEYITEEFFKVNNINLKQIEYYPNHKFFNKCYDGYKIICFFKNTVIKCDNKEALIFFNKCIFINSVINLTRHGTHEKLLDVWYSNFNTTASKKIFFQNCVFINQNINFDTICIYTAPGQDMYLRNYFLTNNKFDFNNRYLLEKFSKNGLKLNYVC